MGAWPEQQLALNFLAAIHELWVENPGNYAVKESLDDLVPALAQMCIKALAADLRDELSPARQHQIVVDGRIVQADGTEKRPDLRDVLNKIIHGRPILVVVEDGAVQLHFRAYKDDSWTEAWFSGTQLLQVLARILFKHPPNGREDAIALILEELGPKRFLPTGVADDLGVVDRAQGPA
jgi:hypothetical protein